MPKHLLHEKSRGWCPAGHDSDWVASVGGRCHGHGDSFAGGRAAAADDRVRQVCAGGWDAAQSTARSYGGFGSAVDAAVEMCRTGAVPTAGRDVEQRGWFWGASGGWDEVHQHVLGERRERAGSVVSAGGTVSSRVGSGSDVQNHFVYFPLVGATSHRGQAMGRHPDRY
uniref:(northern house mosquito) hypothetical protein n=1 Tax=Culex pipiens TaxID=7175 RepID=A0A8D8PG25_CULPI